MFSALFLSVEEGAATAGGLLMVLPAVVIGLGFILAPLFIWSWCKRTAQAVEANTAELRALHNTIRKLVPNQPTHITVKRP